MWAITPGQWGDCPQAEGLLAAALGRAKQRVVADRAYDGGPLRQFIRSRGARAVIPFRRAPGSTSKPVHPKGYARRNVIERFWGRIKQFRRIATRYDKTCVSWGGALCAVVLWLGVGRW